MRWQKINISCQKKIRPAVESALAGGKSGIAGGLVTRAGRQEGVTKRQRARFLYPEIHFSAPAGRRFSLI